MQLPKGIKPHTRKYADGKRRQTKDEHGRPYFYFRVRTTNPVTGKKENEFLRHWDVELLAEEYKKIKAVGWSIRQMTRNTIGISTPDKVVAGYIGHCKNILKMAPGTLKAKERMLLKNEQRPRMAFAEYFMNGHVRLMKSIDVQDISEWLDAVSEDAPPSTWIRHHKEVNALYNWATKALNKEIKVNPVKAIETRGKANDQVQREMPLDAEMDKLVATLANGSGQRIGKFTADQSIIMFAVFSWARRKELVDLKWDHIDWAKGTYSLPAWKGGKVVRDEVVMNAAERELLEWQQENNVHGSEYVFYNSKGESLKRSRADLVQRYFKKAGITKKVATRDGGWKVVGKYGWHSLRHRGISKRANDGETPLFAVMKRARHSKITTTQGYIHDDGQKNEIGGDFDDY
jgi:integrase